MNGALTRDDENEVCEQQLTPCAPPNCQSAADRSKPLDRDRGKDIGRGKRQTELHPAIGHHEDGPRDCSRRILLITAVLSSRLSSAAPRR
eukprot:5192064-Prymnesium_polylepis.1